MRIRDYSSSDLIVALFWIVAAVAACPFCNAEPTPPTVEEVIATWQARTERIKTFECQYKVTEYRNVSPEDPNIDDLFGAPNDNPDTREEMTVARLHSLGYENGNRYLLSDGSYWNPGRGEKEQQWNWFYVRGRDSNLRLTKDGKEKMLKTRETKLPWTAGQFPHPIKLWHQPRLVEFRRNAPDIRKSIVPKPLEHRSGVDCFEMRWELSRENMLRSVIRVQFAQQPPYRILEYRAEFPNGYPLLVTEIDYPEKLDAFHFPASWRVSKFRRKDQSLKMVTRGSVLDFQVNEPVDAKKFELDIPPGTLIEEMTSHGMIRAVQLSVTERKHLTLEEHRRLQREMMDNE